MTRHRAEPRRRSIRTRPVTGGALRTRAFWVIADSALGSLTNAALTIGLARVVSQGQYGAFALSFTFFSLVQSISVAVNNQVVVILFANRDHEQQHRAASAAAAGTVIVGGLCGAAMIVGALFTDGTVRYSLLAMGLMLPALMFQDHWRSTFIAFGEPHRAFVLDALWAVLWVTAFAVLIGLGSREAGLFVLGWGLAALVSGLLGSRLAGAGPDFRDVTAWFTQHREVSLPSLANTFASLGSLQVAFLLVSVFGGVRDLGALRGTQTLLGPLNIVGFAMLSFSVPELVRRAPGRRGLITAALVMGSVLLAVAAAWGAVLLLLPDSAGRQLLGATWASARVTLPGMVVYLCCINSVAGCTAVLRSLNRVRSAFLMSALLGPLVIVCSLVGVLLDGARGASIGFAVAGLLVVAPWWFVTVRDAGLGRRMSATD